jgi:AraC-like DNA-binding protein
VKVGNCSVKKFPTIEVQTYYAEVHSARRLGSRNAFLTSLTTQHPLHFESNGQYHNFNFQIAQGVRTEWKSGMRSGCDVIAPGYVSLNAAQENFNCRVAPVSESVTLHVEMSVDWIKEVRERETNHLQEVNGELLPMMGVWHKKLNRLSMEISLALASVDTFCALQIEQLLLELAIGLIHQAHPLSVELEPRGKLPASSVKRVIDYINDQLAAPHSLDELATTAGFSAFHFARLFKATLGLTPHQYLTWQRILRAQLLLANGSMPMIQIATQLGFDSSSHFAATFRKFTGVTPTSFRAARSQ